MNVFDVMRRHGISPSKRFDQNFLIDNNILERIVAEGEIKAFDTVLEVGPGLGVMTEELANLAKKVIVIEHDKKMVGILEKEILSDHKNVEIIQGDALKVDFPKFDKCVSNIPYSISSGLVEKLGKLGKLSVLLVQKEFADRLVAEPGTKNYSRISVLSQYFFNTIMVKTVSKKAFYPAPKVESAVIKLFPKNVKVVVGDEDFFFKVTRALFAHKNKKVSNALEHARGDFGLDKINMREIAREVPNAEKKPRTMSLEELAEVSRALKERV